MSEACKESPRDRLLLEIKSQTGYMPNLMYNFRDWDGVQQRIISPHVQLVRLKVKERLMRLDISDAKRKGFEEADFATFVSLWWPKASLERLVILAYLVIWIFTWDDEIDEPTGKFWEDLRGAGEFQNQTLQFVEHSLGVSDSLPSNGKLNKVIQSFDVIGGELRACYNMSQRKRFCFEMARYMSKSKVEQQIRLRGEIPTIEEFWDYRMGTSAVNLCTAASEYSLGAAIPSQVMDSKAMRALWDETNIIISTANDLFSLQKEVKHGGVENLVPLYFASGLDFQQSVASTIETLTEAKTRFDGAAATLLATSKHAEYDDQLQDFINVQKSMCVGNIIWSLETKRYGLPHILDKNNGFAYTL